MDFFKFINYFNYFKFKNNEQKNNEQKNNNNIIYISKNNNLTFKKCYDFNHYLKIKSTFEPSMALIEINKKNKYNYIIENEKNNNYFQNKI